MARLPWFAFYPSDWFRDTRCLSFAARGAWIDMLGILWDASPRGTKTLDMEGWASELGKPIPEVMAVFGELQRRGIANFVTVSNGDVTVECRRQLRDEKERSSARVRQERFRENGGGNPLNWMAIRVRILELDAYTCGYCGRKATTVDHILPQSKGGDESDGNLVAACRPCNLQKTNKTLEKSGLTLHYSHRHVSVTSLSRRHHTVESESESESESELKKKKRVALTDAEWLASLKADPTYGSLDIDRLKGKCENWCVVNKKVFSRKRFVNWLNREDLPVVLAPSSTNPPQPYQVPQRRCAWANSPCEEYAAPGSKYCGPHKEMILAAQARKVGVGAIKEGNPHGSA